MICSPGAMTPPMVCTGKLMDASALRRADVDALQLIDSGGLAFSQLRQASSALRQVLADFAAKILIDLDDLKLDFGDFALGWAIMPVSWLRSPSMRAASRSSAVRRLIGTRCFSQSVRTPSSSFLR